MSNRLNVGIIVTATITIITISATTFKEEIKQCLGIQAGCCPIKQEITYPDGGLYKGKILNCKPNGIGVFNLANGDRYEGEVRNGKYHGKGTYNGTDGDHYEGEWENGRLIKGKGILIYKDKARYEGEFKPRLNGSPKGVYHEGFGKMTYPKESNKKSYEGQWKGGVFDGKGKIVWANGHTYEGDFKEGKYYGKGVYIWSNGNRYEGEFKNDSFNGKGVLIWSDGDRYEGEWINDKPHGFGIFTSSNGKRQYQNWDNGQLIESSSAE